MDDVPENNMQVVFSADSCYSPNGDVTFENCLLYILLINLSDILIIVGTIDFRKY